MYSNLLDDKTKQIIENNLAVIRMTYDSGEIKRKYHRFIQYTPSGSYRNRFMMYEYKVFDLITGDTIGNKIERVGNNLFKITVYENHPFDTHYIIYNYCMEPILKFRDKEFTFKKLDCGRTLVFSAKEMNYSGESKAIIYNNNTKGTEIIYDRVRFIEELPDKIRIFYYNNNENKVTIAEYAR